MTADAAQVQAQFPSKLAFLFRPARYKVLYGGRGGAKSWGVARALLIMGSQKPVRVLCARETQTSIQESVHRLLSDQIEELGLTGVYEIQKSGIFGKNGTDFRFAGIRQNVSNIKSYEAVDIVWVEEAQNVSKHSWDVLIPTIRKAGSEIWITFNPELETDETYQRFIVHPAPDAAVVRMNWRDNPWFPDVLRREMEHLRHVDPAAYDHVYEGTCRQTVDGAVYRQELADAEKDSRIARVPYDTTVPVHTFWDLGWGDETTIWFAQQVGFEYHLIDFVSGSQQSLQWYLAQIQQRGYLYGNHHLPHDARAHELGSGKTIEEQARAHLRNVKIVPKLSVADGIAAARALFGRCWFDRDKCADGLQALKHYRYERKEGLGSFSREPLHDWASHAADGFRYFAVGMRPDKAKAGQQRRRIMPVSAWG